MTGEERARLLALCDDLGVPGWLQEHGGRLPKQLVTLVDHEDKAARITDVEVAIVPGLLQTADYARALLHGGANVPPDEIDDRVTARMTRQELFGRGQGTRFVFFLHEAVLHVPVGGPAVLAEQLHHLLRMSVRPVVSIRVVPFAAGAHAAINGAFRLMEFREIRPVVYLEGTTTALFLERREQVWAYKRILESLGRGALDEARSRDVIATVAGDLAPHLEDT